MTGLTERTLNSYPFVIEQVSLQIGTDRSPAHLSGDIVRITEARRMKTGANY